MILPTELHSEIDDRDKKDHWNWKIGYFCYENIMEIDYPPSRQVSSMHLVHVKGILFFWSDFISCKISSRILSSSFLILISSLLKERFTWCLPRQSIIGSSCIMLLSKPKIIINNYINCTRNNTEECMFQMHLWLYYQYMPHERTMLQQWFSTSCKST